VGDLLRTEGVSAYLAFLDDSGGILAVDTSFSGFSFNRILSAPEGGYYLAGEEQKPGGLSYAVLFRYGADRQELWRAADQPGFHSYYQDALLDEEAGLIVLAGTMKGEDPMGKGGTPFIEGVNAETGKREWIKALDEPVFHGAALAAGIAKAPDYGYVVSLAGLSGGGYGPPFIIARVNARGFLVNHTAYYF
jgi:hypothetical protein